jgi:dolichyl-phosphate beta-glucosyltransferase
MKKRSKSKPVSSLLVSFLIPAHRCPELLERNVPVIVQFVREYFPHQAEIVVIPNPCPGDSATLSAAESLARRHRGVKVCRTAAIAGKGLALKEGLALCRGRWIFMTDVDLPYQLSFFLDAARMLRKGAELVSANRRLPQSQFRMATRLLRGAYARYLLGWLLMLVVRCFLPVGTTDTQAGAKAMTRAFAEKAFERLTCPGFLYDLEIFLMAHSLRIRRGELPVQLRLEDRTSTVKFFQQLPITAGWGLRIAWRQWHGGYNAGGLA